MFPVTRRTRAIGDDIGLVEIVLLMTLPAGAIDTLE
jgi:hypothetical protein